MRKMIKAGLTVVLSAVLWTNGGTVKEANAQVCGDGGHYTVDNVGGMMTPVCVGGSAGNRVYGTHPDDGRGPQQQSTNQRPAIKKPSSYGAVAWDGKRGFYGSASKQASKQAADELALRRCKSANCKIMMQYANQCTAVAYGLERSGTFSWTVTAGLTQSKAERDATKKCSKVAKDCKILLSECSPAGEIEKSNQTQQYKGLGE